MRKATPVILEATITCPHCGTAKAETMPTDACQFFYDCTGCGELLQPKTGDCCVFCSYGSVPCPPIQVGETPTCRRMTGDHIPTGGCAHCGLTAHKEVRPEFLDDR